VAGFVLGWARVFSAPLLGFFCGCVPFFLLHFSFGMFWSSPSFLENGGRGDATFHLFGLLLVNL